MKRVYSTYRPAVEQKSYADWITKCDQKLSVSSRGLIAFTSSFCLNQRRPSSTSYHVYVADLNTPYQPHLLVDSEYEFAIIEWDSSGSKLLVCDVRGSTTIYTSKDYLISDWKPHYKQVFAAETFLAAAWYHPGIVSTINVANQNLKNPANHLEYADKVQQSKFGASLRLFGGRAAEGCLLVSKTGLVCWLTLMADSSVDVLCETLGPLRGRIEVADICHAKDGSFVVATSTGSINSTISFYQLYLSTKNITLDDLDIFASQDSRRVRLTCKQFSSFHLNIMSQILLERENTSAFERVAHIKFVTKDSPDGVLVEVSGQNLSLIELWELEPRKLTPIHGAILDLKRTDDTKPNNLRKIDENGSQVDENVRDWSFKGNYITDKDLVNIQTPKFRLFGPNRQLNLILLAYEDSTVCCMRKEDLQPIEEIANLSNGSSMRPNPIGRVDQSDNSPYKVYHNRQNGHNNSTNSSSNNLGRNGAKSGADQRHRSVHITDIQLTYNQTVFIAIDTLSQLHAVRLPPLIACQDAKDQETYLQYILEYCLVTGNDFWDVLVCAQPDSIEPICDKFQDAYERQPKHTQFKYFNRHLMTRASLYRMLNTTGSLCKASDCHTIIMLNSIASTIKSMLRSQDQDSPAERLSSLLKSAQGVQAAYFNCNNVISKINEREFYVEPQLSQCLQPLSQWLTDLAIFLVVSLPQRVRQHLQLPGAGLAHNKEALETIRELLIIIKIWGLQNEASLPVIHKLAEQLDVLAILYRLISLMSVSVSGEADESLVDECVQLANSLSVSQFSFMLEPVGVASPLLYQSSSGSSSSNNNNQVARQQMLMGATTQASQPNQPPTDSYLTLEYFREPTKVELAPVGQLMGAIDMNGGRQFDVVRNISLGAHPVANLRHCTRCKSVSMCKLSLGSLRAWEHRWISSCVCGGSWAQSDNNFVNKLGYLAWLHQNPTLSSFNHAHQMVR